MRWHACIFSAIVFAQRDDKRIFMAQNDINFSKRED